MYFEDLKHPSNAEFEPKDIFETTIIPVLERVGGFHKQGI
jgi:hypothetical protein